MRTMPTKSTEYSMVDVLEEMATLLAGVRIITLAIFPLALPMIALTAVVAIPLALVGLVAALLAAVLAAPIVLVRRLRELGGGSIHGLPRAAPEEP
jgi:hypothetical protein